jgi:glycosyltransferase involved in cell wall biosynthesis
MHVLLIHPEVQFFAGAEKVLDYLLRAYAASDLQVSVAAVPGSRVESLVPEPFRKVHLSDNQRFRPQLFVRQIRQVQRAHRELPFDVLHGWAARDWELTAACGALLRRPTLATLHDPPDARFFSRSRRQLMWWSGRWFLERIVCVSGALKDKCRQAGFPERKLAVVHNGLPEKPRVIDVPGRTIRIGYLGLFSERKGLGGLFQMLDEVSGLSNVDWELHLAGEAQEETGHRLLGRIKETYATRPWWSRVIWHGWAKEPLQFLAAVDVLVCPSQEFDPFPTVLLEAGLCGKPVLAARVGGVPEIVVEGETGWLFTPGDWHGAARRLAQLLSQPTTFAAAGERAWGRVRHEFSITKMVAGYRKLYSTLTRNA